LALTPSTFSKTLNLEHTPTLLHDLTLGRRTWQTARMRLASEPISKVLRRPSGARFFKCALQVNPFEYYKRHSKGASYPDEQTYNAALVDALSTAKIEMIAITDHYRISSGAALAVVARAAGIAVFQGFEAVTKDGVHVLCLFDPDEDVGRIERFIGDCGVHDEVEASPTGDKDFDALLSACNDKWGGICVAAHVSSKGGLLTTLSGKTAIRAWTHEHLHACSMPGPVVAAPANHRPILENRNPDYLRDRPIAVINANDISEPADVTRPGASCWIKMTTVSVEGLRQAFLDPISRLRLASDDEPEDRTELLAMSWEGGFLDGTTLRFNNSLNVLIGGRGTGKSTIIESIRFVLEIKPLVEEARKQHRAFVSQVLGSGAKVSLLLRSQTPSPRVYLIERTSGSRASVKDSDGNLTELFPANIAGEVEVFGQHEISELARSEERLTGLLDRFVAHTSNEDLAEGEIKARLERTRDEMVSLEKALAKIDAELATLPAIREKLRRYKDLGLDERLSDQRQLVSENSVIDAIERVITTVQTKINAVEVELPLDASRLDDDKLETLGGAAILREARPMIEQLNSDLRHVVESGSAALETAKTGLQEVRTKWEARKTTINEAHQKTLRELQKEGINGSEYTDLLQKVEKLAPKKDEQLRYSEQLKEVMQERRKAVKEWEEFRASQFRALERAAKRVSSRLSNRVQVNVTAAGDRRALEQHLRSLGGRIADTVSLLQNAEALSLSSLATACREGKEALTRDFDLPSAQAERLAQAGSDFIARLEELELTATTAIQLNVAREGAAPVWKKLSELSTGQKATAVLLLLLLDSDGPLVVDQPEDDLDNRFITECIVPKLKEQKKRRQFVFATHNANIPVLGDAELIIGLVPPVLGDGADVHIPDENLGSIDSENVCALVEETLEGGRDAFELRRLKYGF